MGNCIDCRRRGFGSDVFNIMDINIFFDGWWTLFIIVPCAIGLFTEREKTGNIIGIAVGVFLLLCCQDILSFSMLWKLLVPAIIVIIGLKMVFTGLFGNKANEIIAKIKQNGGETKVGCATFSGCDLNYDGEVFEGAELTATFGGVKCDLRNAIIEKDCAIQVSAIFGGIDIFVPDNHQCKGKLQLYLWWHLYQDFRTQGCSHYLHKRHLYVWRR